MTNPLVSVVVPNYNYAKYLPERLDSSLQQSYQNFEIIILDDVSTDNSREVIENYRSNPHVSKIVYNERNSGSTFKQWHKGFELAQGELIWIAESDDKCEPVLLERLVAEFEHDKDLVLAFSLTRLFRNDGWTFDIPSLDKDPRTKVAGREFIRRYMSDGCYVTNASSAVFKKEVALNIDNTYTKFKSCGDRLFWIEMAEKGNVAIINERLNYCRRHASTVTSKNTFNGNRFVEGKRIMDYLVSHKYLNSLEELKYSARYIYGNIINQNHLDEHVKRYLLEVWEYGPIRKCYVGILQTKSFLSKFKHFFVR